MKIVFVERLQNVSIWSVVSPVSEKLVSGGYEVFWVRMAAPDVDLDFKVPSGVEVIDIPVPKDAFPCAWVMQLFFFAPAFRKFLKRIQPEIVHTHFAVPGMLARWIAKKAGCKVVSTQHEMFDSMNCLLRAGTRGSERFTDVITYVSKTVADSYGEPDAPVLDLSKKDSANRVVVYNSIDFDQLKKIQEGEIVRSHFKLLCVGRMVPEKGQQILLEAMPIVLKAQPEAELHFCGTGPEEERLKLRAEELGISDAIIFHGWIEKIEAHQHMVSARVVLQPSEHEGFGLTLAEALASGAQVIASDIPVFREVVGDVTSEVSFVAPSDVDQWAHTIMEILAEENQAVIDHSSLELRFSNDVNAASYEEIYKRLI